VTTSPGHTHRVAPALGPQVGEPVAPITARGVDHADPSLECAALSGSRQPPQSPVTVQMAVTCRCGHAGRPRAITQSVLDHSGLFSPSLANCPRAVTVELAAAWLLAPPTTCRSEEAR
jgi:hypothetical protein